MFMPQQKLTPEEKAFLRMRTVSNVSTFVTVVMAIRAVPFALDYARRFF